jgi:hypothetical protein
MSVIALAVAPGTASAAVPAKNRLEVKKDVELNFNGGAFVTLDFRCAGGGTGFVVVTLTQGDNSGTTDAISVPCDDKRQRARLFVGGAIEFTRGSALAEAVLSDAAGDRTTKRREVNIK